MDMMRRISMVAAATTAALIAGFFYAYSASVNRGLGRLGDAEYVATMQAINDTVRNPVFALSFFGALLVLPLAAALHAPRRSARSQWLVAAAVLYVLGGFGVTFAFNVPLNEHLANVDVASSSPAALAAERADYEGSWNAWNAVRTIASTLAVMCVAAAALAADTPRRRRRQPSNGRTQPAMTT